jgi:hypothetical protein
MIPIPNPRNPEIGELNPPVSRSKSRSGPESADRLKTNKKHQTPTENKKMQVNPTSHPRIMPVQPSTTCRWLRGLVPSPWAALALLLLGPSATQATPIPTWLGGSPRPANWAVITDATYNNGGTTRSVAGSTDVGSANGSGLSLVGGAWYNTPTTGAAESMEGWGANSTTDSTATDAGINNGSFQYTFDKAYTITGFMMWNINNQGKRRGTQIMQFQTTTDGVNWDPQIWTDGTDTYNGARTHNAAATTGTLTATGTNTWQATQSPLEFGDIGGNTVPATDVYSGLNWANVVAVRFAPRASYADEAAGVSEIQFTFTPVGFQGPIWLTATDANAQVTLNWGDVTDATGYKVYRSLADGGPYDSLADVPGATTYTDSGLTNGTTYYYVVTATKDSTESTYSPQATGMPPLPPAAGPAGLTTTASNAQVILNWDAAAGATGYKVYRSLIDGGTYGWLATVSGATTYTNTGLTNGTSYYYVVTATNSSGESPYSEQTSATPTPGPDLWVNTDPRPDNWAQVTSATYNRNGTPDTIQQGSWNHTINGAGLTLTSGTWLNKAAQDSTTYVFTGWSVDPIQNSNVGFVVYQFAQAYTIDGIDFWGANTTRGVRRAWFWTLDATTGEWTQRLNGESMDWDFALVTTGDAPPQAITGLNWTNVSSIRFEPRSTTANSGMKVDEIQFTIAAATQGSYTDWLTHPPLWTLIGGDAAKTADPDGDGMTNFQEFAFGLNPVLGSSVNPITAPLDKGTRKFSYKRGAATGLNYTVWLSTDLMDWGGGPVAADQAVGEPIDGVRTVVVTLPDPLPAGGKVFVRVKAE